MDPARRDEVSAPRIWAHRGSHRAALENTLEAFRLAIEEGADGVELDVRAAADRAVMVFHDADLSRLADDPREIAACPRASLPAVGGAPIPTLDEALDLILDAGLEVNVEIKAGSREVAERLARRARADQDALIVSSFQVEALEVVRARLPRIRTAFLFTDAGLVSPATLAAATGLHPHFELCTEARVARWRSRVRFINAWTVNDPNVARALASAGVDGLVTDHVPAMRGACEKHS